MFVTTKVLVYLYFEHFILGDLNAVHHADVDIVLQRDLPVPGHVCLLKDIRQG